jgi:hypothetical protein
MKSIILTTIVAVTLSACGKEKKLDTRSKNSVEADVIKTGKAKPTEEPEVELLNYSVVSEELKESTASSKRVFNFYTLTDADVNELRDVTLSISDASGKNVHSQKQKSKMSHWSIELPESNGLYKLELVESVSDKVFWTANVLYDSEGPKVESGSKLIVAADGKKSFNISLKLLDRSKASCSGASIRNLAGQSILTLDLVEQKPDPSASVDEGWQQLLQGVSGDIPDTAVAPFQVHATCKDDLGNESAIIEPLLAE